MAFYNTTKESGQTLLEFRAKARTQDGIIARFLQEKYPESYTPEEVQIKLNLNCPLTSVRRSISNLTKQGRLVRTEEKRYSRYGRLTYCWRWNGSFLGGYHKETTHENRDLQ